MLAAAQERAEEALPLARYSTAACMAYALYPPLYIAGPILTFNAFASQILRPRPISAAQVSLRHDPHSLIPAPWLSQRTGSRDPTP